VRITAGNCYVLPSLFEPHGPPPQFSRVTTFSVPSTYRRYRFAGTAVLSKTLPSFVPVVCPWTTTVRSTSIRRREARRSVRNGEPVEPAASRLRMFPRRSRSQYVHVSPRILNGKQWRHQVCTPHLRA